LKKKLILNPNINDLFFWSDEPDSKKTWGPLCGGIEIRVGIVGAKVGSFFSDPTFSKHDRPITIIPHHDADFHSDGH